MSRKIQIFEGFPQEAFDFLSELSRNNNKDWFDAHRGVYDTAIVQPALLFVESMVIAFKAMTPSVKAEPRIGGSLFRIHRDVRFSADKSPYKTHVGVRFRDRDTITSSRCTGPLFYVEFDAQALRLGVGVKEFDSRTLAAYRDLVAGVDGSPLDRALLTDMVRLATIRGHEILGPVLSRLPKGYPIDANPELLARKGLFIRSEAAIPHEMKGSEFISYCSGWFRPYVPLFESLRNVALSTFIATP